MLEMQISLLDVLSRKDCYQSDISTILYCVLPPETVIYDAGHTI